MKTISNCAFGLVLFVVSESATVDETADIGSDSNIKAKTVIEANVVVRERCVIGPGAKIGKGTIIRKSAIVGAATAQNSADIGEECRIPYGVFIDIFNEVGDSAILNENVYLGKYACVDAHAKVPANTQTEDRGMVSRDGSIVTGPKDPKKRYSLYDGKCKLISFT